MNKLILVLLLVNFLPHFAFADDALPDSDKPEITYEQLSPSERAIYDRGEIGTGRYVTGGVVGTVVGFGIGQAIEGRYTDTGWIFTVGELGSVVAIAAGAADCEVSLLSGGGCGTGAALIVGGYLGFIGFRIWDAIDAWVVPPEINDRYRQIRRRMGHAGDFQLAAYPLVLDRAPGLGVAISF